jgi:hypothetical protein
VFLCTLYELEDHSLDYTYKTIQVHDQGLANIDMLPVNNKFQKPAVFFHHETELIYLETGALTGSSCLVNLSPTSPSR